MKLGVFHVEAKYTSRGGRLIEVNSRMGGGPVRLTNLLVWGVDLVEEHLMVRNISFLNSVYCCSQVSSLEDLARG